ncbi:unnamed protein product [Kuraishia capsulata CBS 1993]|uniref:Protein transport protein Sec61 subunit beta n=1 Tax=Kuraishia capsulata CBS 1993 TaxID=1382522 RepID=W6MGC2_9ASCO|nr:uncharacterized protein KUCA_T00001076001 [Kuraishia capsulata CBS 1993]CDK25109.1 unnamed protein product [Kuraishia capsulata CBS 1993]
MCQRDLDEAVQLDISNIQSIHHGGTRTLAKRKATQDKKLQQQAAQAPTSSRAAGAGGSSSTMLKLYTDEAQGLKVDPLVVLVLAVGFIFSVIVLHVLAKVTGRLTA